MGFENLTTALAVYYFVELLCLLELLPLAFKVHCSLPEQDAVAKKCIANPACLARVHAPCTPRPG
jgi:hypothetical protein